MSTNNQNHIYFISSSRLDPYIKLANRILSIANQGNPPSKKEKEDMAICIYTVIQNRLSIFFSLLLEIEISFRNAMSHAIKQYAQNNNKTLEEYFIELALNNNSPLTTKSKKTLREAIQKTLNTSSLSNSQKELLTILKNNNKNANDIIANISFGFWVYLINSRAEAHKKHFTHWESIFKAHNLFQNRFTSIKNIYDQINPILLFRNKLYHQEPVWKGKEVRDPTKALIQLKTQYDKFSCLLEKIAPERKQIYKESAYLYSLYESTFSALIFEQEILTLYKDYMGH